MAIVSSNGLFPKQEQTSKAFYDTNNIHVPSFTFTQQGIADKFHDGEVFRIVKQSEEQPRQAIDIIIETWNNLIIDQSDRNTL